MNHILRSEHCRLLAEHVDILMQISIEGPRNPDIRDGSKAEEAPLNLLIDKAVNGWISDFTVTTKRVSEWVSSFLTAHQHILGYLVSYNDVEDTVKEIRYNQGYLAMIKYE